MVQRGFCYIFRAAVCYTRRLPSRNVCSRTCLFRKGLSHFFCILREQMFRDTRSVLKKSRPMDFSRTVRACRPRNPGHYSNLEAPTRHKTRRQTRTDKLSEESEKEGPESCMQTERARRANSKVKAAKTGTGPGKKASQARSANLPWEHFPFQVKMPLVVQASARRCRHALAFDVYRDGRPGILGGLPFRPLRRWKEGACAGGGLLSVQIPVYSVVSFCCY